MARSSQRTEIGARSGLSPTARTSFIVILGGVILSSIAVWNGFPLVYSDTATYLTSGFNLETPFDRPITYGLWLYLMSLGGFSLWPVILSQSALVSYALYRMGSHVFKAFSPQVHLIACAFVTFCSTASWTASMLMPDIFTSLLLVTWMIVAMGAVEKWELVFVFFINLVSCCMHLSHPLYSVIIGLCLLVCSLPVACGIVHRKHRVSIILLMCLSILTLLTMGSAMAKSRSIFVVGAMSENGVLKPFLDEECVNIQYKLCAFKDSLPNHGYDFVWSEKGPVQKLGGFEHLRDECDAIIQRTILDGKYLRLHIIGSLMATRRQLFLNAPGDGLGIFGVETDLAKGIFRYVPSTEHAYLNSKQYCGRLRLGFLWWRLSWYDVVLYASWLIAVIGALLYRGNHQVILLILTVTLGFVVNAWICGTFSNSIDRLGAKIAWLWPYVAVYFGFRFVGPAIPIRVRPQW